MPHAGGFEPLFTKQNTVIRFSNSVQFKPVPGTPEVRAEGGLGAA
jgi:hypothetical protein